MADGTITIAVEMEDGSVKKGIANLDGLASSSDKAGFSLKNMVGAGLLIKGVTAAVGVLTSSMGAAISRFDTLNNSTRSFENMGFTAEETAKTMDSLKSNLQGLPTPLDSAVKSVQLLAASTGDLGKSEQVFSALNNGILGFGGSTEQVENAVMQLSQAFSNGKVDAETWNSMINSGLGPALNALAKQMGKTTGELKAGLSDGSISVEEFQDRLISLNTEGGGGLKSLEQIAKDAMGGISTGVANMKTAVVRGLANIIGKFDELSKILTGNSIGENITVISASIDKAFVGINNAIEGSFPYIQQAVTYFGMFFDSLNSGSSNVEGVLGSVDGLKEAFMNFGTTMFSVITEQILPALMNFYEQFYTTFNTIMETVLPILTDIITAIVDFATQVAESFGNLFTGENSIVNSFMNAFNSIIEVALPILESALELIRNILSELAIFWAENGQQISDIVKTAFELISTIIQTVMTYIGPYLQTAWENIRNVIEMVWDAIKGIVEAALDIIQGILEVVMGVISGDWDRVWNGMQTLIEGVLGMIGTIVDNALNGIQTAFEVILNSVVTVVRNQIDLAKSIFESLGDIDLAGAGRAIIDGFLNGLTSAFENVKATVSGWADWIVEHKGPISYDKKLLIPAGKAISGGLFSSMKEGFKDVQALVNGFGGQLQSEFGFDNGLAVPSAEMLLSPNESFGGLGQVVNNNTSTTRTINNTPNITMNVTCEGKEDIRKTMQEMAWITTADERGGL